MNSSRTPRPTARILDGRHELVVDGLSLEQDSFTLPERKHPTAHEYAMLEHDS
ncbi:hypothetical protein [Streptomyces antibioticus]|uniref:hypothetical protein n=1 Tax=Streptomyces antibioticus TaxID=1890 RepID=UPI0033B785B2